jgi:hypothetical protein
MTASCHYHRSLRPSKFSYIKRLVLWTTRLSKSLWQAYYDRNKWMWLPESWSTSSKHKIKTKRRNICSNSFWSKLYRFLSISIMETPFNRNFFLQKMHQVTISIRLTQAQVTWCWNRLLSRVVMLPTSKEGRCFRSNSIAMPIWSRLWPMGIPETAAHPLVDLLIWH